MSNQKTTKATAQVRLTIEMAADGNWGGDCTIKQIHDQARRECLRRLQNIVDTNRHMKIIGEPTVLAVLVEAET